jgi:hypothetical protein
LSKATADIDQSESTEKLDTRVCKFLASFRKRCRFTHRHDRGATSEALRQAAFYCAENPLDFQALSRGRALAPVEIL